MNYIVQTPFQNNLTGKSYMEETIPMAKEDAEKLCADIRSMGFCAQVKLCGE